MVPLIMCSAAGVLVSDVALSVSLHSRERCRVGLRYHSIRLYRAWDKR